MKAAHVFITMPVGGAEDLVLSLMRMCTADIDLQAVCLRELGASGTEAADAKFPIHFLPVALSRQMNPLGIWRLSRWLRREKFDLVHSHVYNAHVYAVLAAKLAGLPCVMHHHKTFNRDRKRRWLTLRVLSKLTAVQITLSEQTRLDLLSALSLKPDNVFAISNAVDNSIFNAATDKRKIRRELGLPEAGFLMGAVASLNPQKNHAATVKMCRTLRDRCVDFHAVICGEGKLRGDLEKEIAALDVGSVLRLAGNQRPIHPWLQCFDALLLPSTWEGQPLILLQALACGTPVIASRIEGNIAALGADHLGLFDLDKADDYANTVQKLATETSFRERLLAHQQKTFSQQPALQDYAVKLRKVYNLAIEPRSVQKVNSYQ